MMETIKWILLVLTALVIDNLIYCALIGIPFWRW